MQLPLKSRTVPIAGLTVWLISFCSAPVFAQSLADIARQEQERKKEQAPRAIHVYTNEDLKKAQILVPEDQVRAIAARNAQTPGNIQTADVPAAAPLQSAIPTPHAVADAGDEPGPASSAPKAVQSRASSALAANSTRGEARSASEKKLHKNAEMSQIARSAAPLTSRKVVLSATVIVVRSVPAKQKAPSPNSGREQDTVSEVGRVLVAPGDSLWKLAERYIGHGTRWHELAELNPQLHNPNLIRVGEWLRVPSSEPRDAKRVVVRAGDTLWSVAQAAWGSPLAVHCIVRANPQLQSADLILPGQTLTLPQTCGVAR